LLSNFSAFPSILKKLQKNQNFRTEKLSAEANFGRKFFRPKVFVLNVFKEIFVGNARSRVEWKLRLRKSKTIKRTY